MNQTKTSSQTGKAVQTTGHAWDGDLQEFNNPLPRWWLWSFYATVIFAVVYWFLYPAWPVGRGYTTGPLHRITYKVGDEVRTTHWNTRARLVKELEEGKAARRQREYMEKIAAADFDTILADPRMMDFTRSVGKVLFADNCAACHGAGGEGKVGLFPSLVDDDWLWGGSPEAIQTTIREGRRGFMPAFGETLAGPDIEAVAEYVLSLSGHSVDESLRRRGEAIFQGQEGGCHYCHGEDGRGIRSLGSANLTDAVWTIADVPGAPDHGAARKAVAEVVRKGVSRQMPAWKGRLSDTEIKLLTVYVYDLGGGS